jgi:hypothetical protein
MKIKPSKESRDLARKVRRKQTDEIVHFVND